MNQSAQKQLYIEIIHKHRIKSNKVAQIIIAYIMSKFNMYFRIVFPGRRFRLEIRKIRRQTLLYIFKITLSEFTDTDLVLSKHKNFRSMPHWQIYVLSISTDDFCKKRISRSNIRSSRSVFRVSIHTCCIWMISKKIRYESSAFFVMRT